MINSNCVFCKKPADSIIMENKLAKAFYDINPVSTGHILIVPKNHVSNYFDLTDEQVMAIHHLLLKIKSFLDQKYHPIGYNIGANCGRGAGQAVMHAHIHVIPRYHNQRPKSVNNDALRVPSEK